MTSDQWLRRELHCLEKARMSAGWRIMTKLRTRRIYMCLQGPFAGYIVEPGLLLEGAVWCARCGYHRRHHEMIARAIEVAERSA